MAGKIANFNTVSSRVNSWNRIRAWFGGENRYFWFMNLPTAFGIAAEKDLRKTALFWGEREYSFDELLSQTRMVAGYLQNKLGLKPGDRVGLWLKNCPES